jgi:hypothetical protein
MASNLLTPPRFVPTLTAVLELPSELSTGTPDEVGKPDPTKTALPVSSPDVNVALRPAEFTDDYAFKLDEQLLHRVLQRVDLKLEERLSDAVSVAVQQQLDAMVPRLREEIESVLRALVVESLSQELSENTGSVPAPGT